VEPTLVVVGLNHRTAAVEVRERFWMSGCRQAEVLSMLSQAEGIEELLVYSTCNRTEFVIWGDPTLAVNSVLRLLTAEYDLKLQEWASFYRLLDERALAHTFRVSCGLDSMCVGEDQIASQVNTAWRLARNTGCAGQHLDEILRHALALRRRVRRETSLGSHITSPARAALQVADRIFGSLVSRNIVVLGAGDLANSIVRALAARGVQSLAVVNRTASRAQDLLAQIGAPARAYRAFPYEERDECLQTADLVISATASAGFVLTPTDMLRLAPLRKGRKLILIDLALPRGIHPAVREFDGVLLYDLEDLERAFEPRIGTRAGESEAEKIVLAEVRACCKQLMTGGAPPELTALRVRIDEICRQELEAFRMEKGPFLKDQERLLTAVTARITSKIAGSLARELKGPASPKPVTAGP
jgi:glutamyl-tRNA reductase